MNRFYQFLSTMISAVSLLSVTGCQNSPGTHEQQGAAVGGVGGAASGAAIGGENHQVLGAFLGAGAGYVVGASSDRIRSRDVSGASHATQQAQTRPATVEDARRGVTADLNNDGFVTLDEVAALKDAGFSDQEALNRLRLTGQIFELTAEQEQFLRSRGVSERVIGQMQNLNNDRRMELSMPSSGVISRPAGTQ
jgi:hypothetical protein